MKNFEYDIFLGGPPDRRAPFPYKEMIKDTFPELNIYDWENYQGKDYQAQNHAMIRKSLLMVSLVPAFPMPGIGPEIGYFYSSHEERILANHGIPQIIMIWPDEVKPDFTKKTLAQYGVIVDNIEDAISYIRLAIASLTTDQFFKETQDDSDNIPTQSWELPVPVDPQLPCNQLSGETGPQLSNQELLDQIQRRNPGRTPPLHPGPEKWRRD